jgi:hypothetical protein
VSTWLITKLLVKYLLIPPNNYNCSNILWLYHIQVLLPTIFLHLQALICRLTYSSASSSSFFSVIRNWTAIRTQGVRLGLFRIMQSSCNTATMLLRQSWTQWLFPYRIFRTRPFKWSTTDQTLGTQHTDNERKRCQTWDQVWSHKGISYINQKWLVRFQVSVMAISCARQVCDLWGWAIILYIFFSVNTEQPMFGFHINSTVVLGLSTRTLIVSLCISWTQGNILLNFLS